MNGCVLSEGKRGEPTEALLYLLERVFVSNTNQAGESKKKTLFIQLTIAFFFLICFLVSSPFFLSFFFLW